ncbi:MAG: restriction endonuclease [Treponema sp.]|nr:restriction endonuclease [Treponema sp.]
MAIPDYQSCMRPLLKKVEDGKVYKFKDLVEALAQDFHLTDDEKNELIPSGVQSVINSRVGWARTYLTKALCLESPQKGMVKITERGKKFLSSASEKITTKDLQQFEEFIDFVNSSKKTNKKEVSESIAQQNMTPEEAIDYGTQMLNQDLASDLLAKILTKDDKFFENLVVQLLEKMGYGGDFEDSSDVVGKTGDGGIDGIIKEDKLGFDTIYVQAKRYTDASVGRPDLQKFSGALAGKNATKGVFITTSKFADTAKEYVKTLYNQKIILIDGKKLCELMIEYNLGVATNKTIEIKKIDTDFFEEE